jgi:hypothetical protein
MTVSQIRTFNFSTNFDITICLELGMAASRIEGRGIRCIVVGYCQPIMSLCLGFFKAKK